MTKLTHCKFSEVAVTSPYYAEMTHYRNKNALTQKFNLVTRAQFRIKSLPTIAVEVYFTQGNISCSLPGMTGTRVRQTGDTSLLREIREFYDWVYRFAKEMEEKCV